MKNTSEFFTESCSQWLATELEEHYSSLAAAGLTGFEIYEALAEGEIQ